uniref:Enoyl-CoA delta isomerase 2, mitochondrial n=1 Tax=Strongyloides stercoralis TaxID=6248 RepID=A0A0K0ED36_STRER
MFSRRSLFKLNFNCLKNHFVYYKHNVSLKNKTQTIPIQNLLNLQSWVDDYCKLQAHATINSFYNYEISKSRLELKNNNALDFKFELPNVKIEKQSKAFVITIDNVKNKNALTMDMYEGITEALNYSLEDRTTSITILTGKGQFFSSGNNFTNIQSFDFDRYLKVYKKFMLSLIDHDKPLIGFINGPAIGIMAEVLPLFDYLLFSSNAYFKTLSVDNKCFAGGCSTFTFPYLIGKNISCDFLTRGRTINAMEGKDLGLINSVVLSSHFNNVAKRKINQFSKIDPVSLVVIKKLFRNNIRKDLYECLNKEMMLYNLMKKNNTISRQLMFANK